MCVTNVYTDRYPDGKELEFRQTVYCQDGQPLAARPCQELSTLEHPVRKIQFGEPTTEYMRTTRPPRSLSTYSGYGYSRDAAGTERRRLTARVSKREPRRRSDSGYGGSSRSAQSRDESDYKKSAITRTTRSLSNYNGDENVTIKVTGQARVMLGVTQINCDEGGEIMIKRRENRHGCTECRRRKQRCDGESPCNNCTRRYPPVSCTYKYDASAETHNPSPSTTLNYHTQPSISNRKLSRGLIVEDAGYNGDEECDLQLGKNAKHKHTPQDIDPSFPSSDPEDEEDERDHADAVNDSDEHVRLHGKFEESYEEQEVARVANLPVPDSGSPAIEVDPGNKEKSFETKKQLYTRSSSAESLQSLVNSIFSIASLSSASTIAETNDAFQRVLSILKTDAALNVLYTDSITKTSADKFDRNFGILLKRFAVDLEKEAGCWNEQRAAQFIRGRARAIAQKVATTVLPSQQESQTIQTYIVEQDKAESSDDSDFEEEPDEFAELEIFITSSTAFRKLRDNIRGFLGLEPSQEHAVFEVSSCKLHEELPFAHEDHVDLLIGPVFDEQCPVPDMRNIWQLPSFSQKIRDYLFPEPAVADGMTRVRWKCPCGDNLYDDYRELKPGAAKRMEEYLRGCYYKNYADSKSISERVSDIGSSWKSIICSLSQRIETLRSGERPELVNTELRYYSDARATRTPAHTLGEVFYLLLCHNSGVGAEVIKLRQPDICDINNDHKLFSFLHEEYIILRKRWWTWISLWTLQSIKFVRFELHENGLVDVKKVDEVPPPTKDNDYRHGPPNPPELNPPLGPTILMHLFKHPDKAGTKNKCLKKIPRKLRNRLAIIDEEEDAIGWGLQFVEGWSKKRLMYMTALTFGLSSFIVLVLVSILGHDIQNAAAIASFMLSFVTIGIATAQAALHMS